MGTPHRGPRPDSRKAGPPTLPAPNRVRYFAEDGALSPELLDQEAEARAKQLSKVSKTQLRRFFEHVLALDRRLRLEGEAGGAEKREHAFQTMRAEFKMLKAKAVYAHGRDDRQFPKEFLQFFIDHVNAVNHAKDFDAFCRHFEAVVAFHKFYGEGK